MVSVLTAPLLWFGAGVLFCILEMLVPAGAFLFFAAGCLAGWLAALAGAGLTVQILAAVAACILSLLVLRRRLTAVFSGRQKADEEAVCQLTGAVGTVTVPVSPDTEGQVQVAGSYWRAVSEDGELGAGEEVRVTGQAADDAMLLRVRRSR